MSEQTPDEFIKMAKEAVLGSPEAWDLLLESDPERFSLWLTETIQDIQNQLGERRAQFLAWKSERRRSREDFATQQGQYFAWKKSALRFKQSCEERKRQLTYEVKRARATARPDDSKRAISDLITRAQEQRDHAVDSLADLASLVEALVEGKATSEDLNAALDDLTVMRKRGGTLTLRELLGAMRKNDGEAA